MPLIQLKLIAGWFPNKKKLRQPFRKSSLMDYTARYLEKFIKICLWLTGAVLLNIAAINTCLFEFALVKI